MTEGLCPGVLACSTLTSFLPSWKMKDAMKERELVLLSAKKARYSAPWAWQPWAWRTGARARSIGGVYSPQIFMKSSRNLEFTLLEMLITISIGLIMAGVTFIALMPMFKENHVNAPYDTPLSPIPI